MRASIDTHSIAPKQPYPALFTNTSILPLVEIICATALLTASALVTSNWIGSMCLERICSNLLYVAPSQKHKTLFQQKVSLLPCRYHLMRQLPMLFFGSFSLHIIKNTRTRLKFAFNVMYYSYSECYYCVE